MIPPLLKTGAVYNTAFFSRAGGRRGDGPTSPTLPLEEQPDAWGALDEKIGTEYFPSIPTAFRNDLFAFGERIGNPEGDGLDRCAVLQGPVRHPVTVRIRLLTSRSSEQFMMQH